MCGSRSICDIGLSVGMAVVIVFGLGDAALANDNTGWAGGYANYSTVRGGSANIETCDPYSPSPGYSSAYVMIDTAGEYIQIGWTKDLSLRNGYREYFWEWENSYTGQYGGPIYFGAPGVGSAHNYMINSGSSAWYFDVDGQGITSMPLSRMTYELNQLQYFGETSDRYHNRYPGSLSNHCSFTYGKYKTNGTWFNAYFNPYADTYGATNAAIASSSFDVWDTRP